MSWQRRLRAFVLAGGALAGGALVAAGCVDDGLSPRAADMAIPGGDMTYVFGCANGAPDPCCLHPTSKGCPSDGGSHD